MRTTTRLARVRELAATGTARAIREGAGVTGAEMAREIGVAVSTLWRWEHGERAPRGPAAVRWLGALDDLLTRGSRR